MDKNTLKTEARKLVERFATNELREGYKPIALHVYDNELGNLIYIRIRLKHPDGRKWIRPFHFSADKQNWVLGEPQFNQKKPLYHLSNIAKNPQPSRQIFVGDKENTRFSTEYSEISGTQNIRCMFNQITVSHNDTKAEKKQIEELKNKNDSEM